jgi:hypothetical protein
MTATLRTAPAADLGRREETARRSARNLLLKKETRAPPHTHLDFSEIAWALSYARARVQP